MGVAHACGHDIHTSVAARRGRGARRACADLPGTVVFVFQPAEEGPPPGEEAGADADARRGSSSATRSRQAIFALHAFPSLHGRAGGRIATRARPRPRSTSFIASSRGKQSHGAYPHLGVDPVVMASQAVLALQTIRSRNLAAAGAERGDGRHLPRRRALQHHPRRGPPRRHGAHLRRARCGRPSSGACGRSSTASPRPAAAPSSSTTSRTRRRRSTTPALGRSVRPRPRERRWAPDNVITVRAHHGRRGLRLLRQRMPGFYFRLGIVEPGDHLGRPAHPRLPRPTTARSPVGDPGDVAAASWTTSRAIERANAGRIDVRCPS